MKSKEARKELKKAYKEQRSPGGVYTITNRLNGKYLLDSAARLKSAQNHFQWAVSTGTPVHPKLLKDWNEFGANVFALDVLEELEQLPEQSQAAFLEDMKALEQLWRAKLDPAKAY